MLLPFKIFDHTFFLYCCGEWLNTSRAWSFFILLIYFWSCNEKHLRWFLEEFSLSNFEVRIQWIKKRQATVVFFPWFSYQKKIDHDNDMIEVKSWFQGISQYNANKFHKFWSISVNNNHEENLIHQKFELPFNCNRVPSSIFFIQNNCAKISKMTQKNRVKIDRFYFCCSIFG